MKERLQFHGCPIPAIEVRVVWPQAHLIAGTLEESVKQTLPLEARDLIGNVDTSRNVSESG